MLKAGIWYLVAQKGTMYRTYRIGRISAAEVQDESYERPPGFDLAAWWAQTAQAYEAGSYRYSAIVRLSPRGLALLEQLGPYVMEAVTRTAGKPDRRGWVRCTIPVEGGETGIRELMRLGTELEVVSPATIRARMARTLQRMLASHVG